MTWVISVAVLFADTASLADETVAVFDKSCSLAGEVTEIVIVGAAELAAMDDRVQETLVEPEHVHPEPEADPVIPPGRGSDTLIDEAGWEELLVTISV